MVNTIYLFSFVETPRKFNIAELLIRKLGSSSVLIILLLLLIVLLVISIINSIISISIIISINSIIIIVIITNNSIVSTDEDPSLRIESSAIINLRGVSTKLNKYINNWSQLSICMRTALDRNPGLVSNRNSFFNPNYQLSQKIESTLFPIFW